MERAFLIGILMTAGATATLGAARVGLATLRRSASSPVAAEKQRRVTVGPTRLRYFEDDNVLTLYTEPARDRDGYYTIVYVPSERKWLKEMPEWCRHRRGEVLAEIKRLTAGKRIKWVEGDDTVQLPNKVLQADDHLGRFASSAPRR
jgi:hypothetical protein